MKIFHISFDIREFDIAGTDPRYTKKDVIDRQDAETPRSPREQVK